MVSVMFSQCIFGSKGCRLLVCLWACLFLGTIGSGPHRAGWAIAVAAGIVRATGYLMGEKSPRRKESEVSLGII